MLAHFNGGFEMDGTKSGRRSQKDDVTVNLHRFSVGVKTSEAALARNVEAFGRMFKRLGEHIRQRGDFRTGNLEKIVRGTTPAASAAIQNRA